MIPEVFGWGIILYETIQALVAFLAVVLALKWNKTEFLAGLCFLFMYAVLNLIDFFFFTITQGVYLDIAQFGFILLSIIFFIIGMHHSWPLQGELSHREQEPDDKSSNKDSVLSTLKKL
jgi:hypothetical protein